MTGLCLNLIPPPQNQSHIIASSKYNLLWPDCSSKYVSTGSQNTSQSFPAQVHHLQLLLSSWRVSFSISLLLHKSETYLYFLFNENIITLKWIIQLSSLLAGRPAQPQWDSYLLTGEDPNKTIDFGFLNIPTNKSLFCSGNWVCRHWTWSTLTCTGERIIVKEMLHALYLS